MKLLNSSFLSIHSVSFLLVVLFQFNSLDARVKAPFESKIRLSSCFIYPIEHEDSLIILGNYYHELVIDYYYQMKYDSAIIMGELELKHWQNYEAVDSVVLGKAYHNLGSFYRLVGHTIKAKKHLLSAIDIFKELNVDRLLKSYIELSNTYLDEGAYQSAKYYCELVIRETRPHNKSRKIKAYNNLGSCMIELNQLDEFISIKSKIKVELGQLDIILPKVNFYNNLAIVYYKLEEYKEAIESYDTIIKILEKEEILSELPNKYSQLGLCYLKLGKMDEALFYLEKGVSLALANNAKETLALCFDNLGTFYLVNNNHAKALSFFQKSLRLLIPSFNPTTDFENPTIDDLQQVLNKPDLLVYLLDKASALSSLEQQQSKRENPLELYLVGDHLIDLMSKDHQMELTKLYWREEVRPFYEAAITVCFELNDVKSAFYFIEKSKGILLLGGIKKNKHLGFLPNNIFHIYYDLKKQLTVLKDQYNYSELKFNSDQLKELIQTQENLNQFMDSLSVLYPNQFGNGENVQVISFDRLKSEIESNPKKLYLNYFYGIDYVFVLSMQKGKYNLENLGRTKEIKPTIKAFIGCFESASIIENNPTQYVQLSNQLYQKILMPVIEKDIYEIIVFPDGDISRISFDALVVNKNGTALNNSNFLIDECITNYAFSSSILFESKDPIHYDEYKIAAFSPFTEIDSSKINKVDILNYDELLSVKNKLDISYFNNESASKDNFFRIGKTHQAIHLSSHALCQLNSDNPRIYFSDSSLYFSELYGLAFPVDLVVLSACGTNVGQMYTGEGVLSLTRGFRYSGAKSIVSSLWNVQAASTALIMNDFYSGLANGLKKHEALHLAKKEYRANLEIPSYEKSPYYWAGMVFYGSSNTIPICNSSSDWMYRLGIIGSILLLLIIRRKGHLFIKTNR